MFRLAAEPFAAGILLVHKRGQIPDPDISILSGHRSFPPVGPCIRLLDRALEQVDNRDAVFSQTWVGCDHRGHVRATGIRTNESDTRSVSGSGNLAFRRRFALCIADLGRMLDCHRKTLLSRIAC